MHLLIKNLAWDFPSMTNKFGFEDLTEYKAKKKTKLIVNDLTNISKVLHSTLTLLEKYTHYFPVHEIVQEIHDKGSIIEIHLNHGKRKLEEYENKDTK